MDLFTLAGALGLALITAGVLVPGRTRQDVLFIVGGILLEAYSIWIGNAIFMILQAVFVLAAAYSLWERRTTKNA